MVISRRKKEGELLDIFRIPIKSIFTESKAVLSLGVIFRTRHG